MVRTPSYRKREIRGKSVAIVTLVDCFTKRRREHWLGEYGSPKSYEQYHRLLAQWEAAGRRLHDLPPGKTSQKGVSITQICAAYYENEPIAKFNLSAVQNTIRLLNSMYGPTVVSAFGPNALRRVREAMIKGSSTRSPWARSTVVKRTALIISIFRWAVAHEMIDESLWRRLQSLEPLGHRRSDIKMNRKILPVPMQHVRVVQQVVSRPVAAIIELQLLTGARVEEILYLKPGDIDKSRPVWIASLVKHKTSYRGKPRTLYFGPKAQDVLRPFLLRAPSAYMFSPAESDTESRRKRSAARKTPLSCGNKPGSNRMFRPLKKPRDHYDRDFYGRCIKRACKMCEVPAWSPRQLRHNAATEIEKQYDSVTAAIMLGHSSATITEAVYIQRENTKAVEVAAAIG